MTACWTLLRLELPPQWSGPFKITPAMPFAVNELPGLNRRQLVVFPETPLAGATHLHIAGPLAVAGGERPAAPDIYLVGVPRLARYFLLPRRIEDQQLSWDTRGLIPKPLPEELAAIVSDAPSYRSYQLLRGGYRAVLRSAERTAEDPQVRMADISTSCQADGSCWGVAAFDLEPAGATNCLLEMPDGLQLVNVLVDGAAAQRVAQGDNRFNIWLGDNKLPRRLEVIFAGRAAPSGGSIVITCRRRDWPTFPWSVRCGASLRRDRLEQVCYRKARTFPNCAMSWYGTKARQRWPIPPRDCCWNNRPTICCAGMRRGGNGFWTVVPRWVRCYRRARRTIRC